MYIEGTENIQWIINTEWRIFKLKYLYKSILKLAPDVTSKLHNFYLFYNKSTSGYKGIFKTMLNKVL